MATDPNQALIARTQAYSNSFPATTIGALSADVTAVEGDMATAQTDILDLEHTDITDPGASGAIPVNANGCCQIVTAGAETRTLAIPSRLGLLLNITFRTDGGDCVIATASAINQTGNNRITLNDAGDSIMLRSVKIANALAWRVVVNDGCTLSTV